MDPEYIKYILSISSLVISIATYIYVKGAGKKNGNHDGFDQE